MSTILRQWWQNKTMELTKTRRASPSSPGTSTSGPPTPPPLEYIPPIPGLLHYRQMGGLGTGAFGRVILARDTRDNALVAIKLLPRGDFIATFKTYVMREIMHQGSLWHPHVVALREVFTTPQYLAIAMEYAAGGDLFRHLRHERPAQRLPEAEARRVFQQLVIGLDYCHTRGVANRDLKLENLLLSTPYGNGAAPSLKICDFGYSKHELNSSAKTGVGTPIYMAPEVIYGGSKYNAKLADLWSVGVILYTMLFGQYPFAAAQPNDCEYARKIIKAEYDVPPSVPASADVLDLLARLLVADPRQRIPIAEIMQHPWFLRDLPLGAADMNRFYLDRAPVLHPLEKDIEQMVDVASGPVSAQEAPLACSFDGVRLLSIQMSQGGTSLGMLGSSQHGYLSSTSSARMQSTLGYYGAQPNASLMVP
ncbi:SNRK2E [Auxenochlorella protothecoides x Auxenochlorella symbiontica]